MKQINKYLLILLSSLLICLTSGLLVEAQVPNQAPIDAVYDETGLLTADTRKFVTQLNEQLAQTTTKPQIAVLVVDSLNGEPIEQLALKTARDWQIGFSDTNNGALFVVAIKDKKMRLETTDTLAQYVPDVLTKQITDVAKDDFRARDYNSGVQKVLTQLTENYLSRLDNPEQINNKTATLKQEQVKTKQSIPSLGTIIIFFIFAGLFVFKNKKLCPLLYWYTNHDDDYHNHHGGSFGSGSSSRGNSGSSWSGEGFSGGGSSNSW